MSAIHTYPVKGCRRLDHDAAFVEPWGLAGDRRWLVADPAGVAVTQRDIPALGRLRAVPGSDGITLSYHDRQALQVPDPVGEAQVTAQVWGTTMAAMHAGREADLWLSAAFGRQVRLVWLGDPAQRGVSFADELPVLLTTTASLNRLNDWIAESGSDEGPLPMSRFRPNIVIDGAAPFEEDEWVGKTIHIGQTDFKVVQGCGRCVVTTIDQHCGVPGKEPLRTLGRYRNVGQKLLFGVHLTPVAPGHIHLGDILTT